MADPAFSSELQLLLRMLISARAHVIDLVEAELGNNPALHLDPELAPQFALPSRDEADVEVIPTDAGMGLRMAARPALVVSDEPSIDDEARVRAVWLMSALERRWIHARQLAVILGDQSATSCREWFALLPRRQDALAKP